MNKLMGTKPLSFFTGSDGAGEQGGDSTTDDKDGGKTPMFTGKELAAYCETMYANKNHWAYWYGTYGNVCTMKKYKSKKKQYPDHYGSSRTEGYMEDIEQGRRCADCVGMIKSFFWTGGKYDTDPKYGSNGCPDKSANGMIDLCKVKGAISTIPDVPGIVVWKDGHIGVYVGGGYTVEMRGFNYDCVKRKVKDGPWTKWGRLPASMLAYTDEPTPEPEPVGERDLRNGDTGPDVQQMQEDLISLGYSCGKWGADGEYGDATEMAVEAFQKDHGLPVTGVYDAATREAMDKALDEANKPVDPPAEPKTVEIVGGDCYVRTAPNTSGKKLGVAHEGDRLPYGGQTSDNGWNLVEYRGQNGWVSGKYSKLIDGGGAARGAKIVDLSHHKAVLDYDALVRDTALIILRAGVRKTDGRIYEDDKFEAQAAALAARGVRFGVFFYSMAATTDQAREEVRAFIHYAKDKKPLFWALDAERPEITAEAIAAFAEELRALGAERVGCYVAHHRYREYNFDSVRGLFDFIWIPNYIAKPSWPCDLWQYTDEGGVGGINSNVDLNRITGEGHDLSWFTGG